MTDDSRVRHLLEEALGSGRTPEDICAEFPELLSEVRERWLQCRSVNAQIDILFPPSSPSTAFANRRSMFGAGARLPQIPGYDVQSILGRGGMGVVYQARHLKLNRPVALKMLIAGAYAAPHELARFAREAQAIAGIRDEHIVRVHDVGEFEGRPYFTMEFIEGGSLSQKMAGAPQNVRDAASMLAKLARAVEVAHHSGIVHRDLKPSNILLTANGTPKISDFGLARSLTNEQDLTLSGARVGTPSYMAPEQALGKAGAAGPLVDVYALGAILYEMLTGRPPFTSDSAVETQWKLLEEEPVPPSRLNRKVPRDLQTICLKCLQKDPQRRYGTALAMAEDLKRFLHGEPVAARPARFPERATKWARRHPSEAALIISGVIAAFVLLAAGLSIRFQRAEVARAVDDDLLEVARREVAADWTDARTALERAKARLGTSGPAALRDRVNRAEADLDLVARLAAILLDRAAVVEGRFDVGLNKARADAAYQVSFQKAGLGSPGDDVHDVAERIVASKVQGALIAALDDWAFCTRDERRQDWILSVARLADRPQVELRNQIRNPASWKNQAALNELANIALASKASVQMLVALGERLRESGADEIPLLKNVQREHPDDFWANFALGEALRIQHSPEAIRYFQAAIGIQPDAVAPYNNLGISLVESGRSEEAVDYFRRALRIDGKYAPAHNNLGIALTAKGALEDAVDHFTQALQAEPNDSDAHNNIGIALSRLEKWNEAIAHFREAIRISPTDGPAHNNLGIALRNIEKLDEAIVHFGEAVRLRPDDADALNNFGIVLRDKGRVDEAIDQFLRALKVRPQFVEAHGNVGIAFSQVGRFDDAIEHFRRAIEVNGNDAGQHNNLGLAFAAKGSLEEAISEYQRALEINRDDGPTHNNLGITLKRAGRLREAIDHFKEAVRLRPSDPDSRRNLAAAQAEIDLQQRPGAP